MKRHIYLRVSSEAQSFAQQKHCVDSYFARMGIDPYSIDSMVVEKISGTVNHAERKLADLIAQCESGDFIIVSELSRISRSLADLYAIVTECCDKGISLIQAKDGVTIENNTISGKAILFALGLAAEIEVMNIRQRTQMALSSRQQRLKEQGEFISKSGRVCTKLGRPADENGNYDMTAATEASVNARQAKSKQWRKTSVGYASVRRWLGQGQSRRWILEEFNAHHKQDPDNYSTPKGKPLDKGTLSKWIKEMGGQIGVIMAEATSH